MRIASIGAVLLPLTLQACQSLQPMEIRPEWRESAFVYATAVRSPVDAFVYMRTARLACAVKFSDLRGNCQIPKDAKLGDRIPCTATYETICQNAGRSSQVLADATRTHGKVHLTVARCHISSGCSLYDIAPMAVVFGSERFGVAWSAPNGLTFISAEIGQTFEMRHVMQLAPTAVSDEARIDFTHPKLRWYSLSDRSRTLAIPVGELPR